MSTAEQINNAINALDFQAEMSHQTSEAVKRSCALLFEHWSAWWGNRPQPDLLKTYDATLRRYVQWYARAVALVPRSVRAKVPDPRTIAVSSQRITDEQWRTILDANESASSLASDVANGVSRLAVKTGDTIARSLLGPLFVLCVGLYFWGRK